MAQQVQFPLFAGARGMGMGPFATMYTKDPRQALAYNLMAQGASAAPVQHWTQGAARLAQALVGGLIDNRTREEYEGRNKAMTGTLTEALRQMQGTPAEQKTYGDGTTINWNAVPADKNKAIQTLASNQDTAPMAFQMLGIGRQAETFGSPVKAVGKDGKTVYLQIGNRGTTRTLEGYVPPPETVNPTAPMQNYAFRQELVKQFGEGSPQVAQLDAIIRAPQYQNLGGSIAVLNPITPAAGPVQNIGKTLPPEQLPETKGAQTTATETAKTVVEKQSMRPKAEMALQQFERKAQSVTSTIDKALDLAKNSATATGWGNMILGGLPNTDARALNNYLDTIRANLGFDQLQQMRAASPTGGALGAVSEMENRLLQATEAALDPLQANQLVQNLQIIKELYPKVLAEKRAAFDKDYGSGQRAQPPVPPPANPGPGGPPVADASGIKFLGFE
jgi:hypothetical protein